MTDASKVEEQDGQQGTTASSDRAGSGADDHREEEGPERDICVIRPAMFRAHPFKYLLILLILLGGLAMVVLSFIKSAEDKTINPMWMYPGLLVVLIALAWWIQWWVATTLWIKVAISNKRTVRHEGIIRRHSTEVLHDHVRSVDINQTFVQRIFDVGYIGIDSAGQDGIEIEVRDIPSPYKVKEIIDRYRDM